MLFCEYIVMLPQQFLVLYLNLTVVLMLLSYTSVLPLDFLIFYGSMMFFDHKSWTYLLCFLGVANIFSLE